MAIVSPGLKDITESESAELVDWKSPPSLVDLKQDYSAAKPAHTLPTAAVDKWLDVLEGNHGPARDMVLVNSAAALVAAGDASMLKEGVSIAAKSIDEGVAKDKLDSLIELSHRVG